MENRFEQIAKEYGCNTPEELAQALNAVKKQYKYIVERVELHGEEGEHVSTKTLLRTDNMYSALEYYYNIVDQYGKGPWTSFRVREKQLNGYKTIKHSWHQDW